jgi:hypothetical protein
VKLEEAEEGVFMLTIRWYSEDGSESIFQGSSVQRTATTLKVWKEALPALECELKEGTAYVMNDKGATVAVYNLGSSNPDSPSNLKARKK